MPLKAAAKTSGERSWRTQYFMSALTIQKTNLIIQGVSFWSRMLARRLFRRAATRRAFSSFWMVTCMSWTPQASINMASWARVHTLETLALCSTSQTNSHIYLTHTVAKLSIYSWYRPMSGASCVQRTSSQVTSSWGELNGAKQCSETTRWKF